MNFKNGKPKFVFCQKRNGEPYRWIVKFRADKRLVYLGCFKTEREAVDAYEAYRIANL
jgi:hypothetical protein